MQMITRRTKLLMAASGAVGFGLFLACHLWLNHQPAWQVPTALAQLTANTFVHLSWRRGYREASGLARRAAFIGATVPVVMASITISRVFVWPLIARLL